MHKSKKQKSKAEFEFNVGQLYFCYSEYTKPQIYIYEKYEEKTDTRLYVVIKQNHSSGFDLKKTAKNIRDSFFKSLPDIEQSSKMEERLAQVNLMLERNSVDPDSFDCCLCEINNNTLSVSSLNNLEAWMLRGSNFSRLTSNTESKLENENYFASFVSGPLQSNDTVLLVSKNIFNFISIDQLTETLVNSQGQEAANQIYSVIKESNAKDTPVLGMILSVRNSLTKKLKYNKIQPLKALNPWRFKNFIFSNQRSALFLTAGIVLLGLTIWFIGSNISNRNYIESETNITQALDQIDNDLTQAEAAIGYGDVNRAKQMLQRAKTTLNNSEPQNNEDWQMRVLWQNLFNKWEQINEKLP